MLELSVYLGLYVVFSSLFTLCIKWVHVRGKDEDIITVGAINYIVAVLIIGPWYVLDGQQTGDLPAIIAGGSMGVVYFIAFFFVIWCVRVVGASSTSVVSVLSMLIPIVFGALVWSDRPSLLQSAGIGLALLSLILIGLKPDRQSTAKSGDAAANDEGGSSLTASLILGGFFVLCGLSRVAQEAFKHVSAETQKPTFLLAAFVAAGVPAAIVLLWRRRKILPMEAVVGVIMGVSNGAQLWFTLKTLDLVPGYIFFPVSSAGSIIFTMFVAVLWLEERISSRALIGIVIAVVALVMMNMNLEPALSNGGAP